MPEGFGHRAYRQTGGADHQAALLEPLSGYFVPHRGMVESLPRRDRLIAQNS
jgi:hypothetical protein